MIKKPWIKIEILDAYTYVIGRRKSHNSTFYKSRIEDKKKEIAERSFCSKLVGWGQTLVIFGIVAGVFGPMIYLAIFDGSSSDSTNSTSPENNSNTSADSGMNFDFADTKTMSPEDIRKKA